jgi:hypothetical protein
MLTIGGGRLVSGLVGCVVVGDVDDGDPLVVVGPLSVLDVVGRCVVVVSAAGERCSSFS